MSRYRVDLGEEAERNVIAIQAWIAQRSGEGAVRWYRAFCKAIEALENDAERFPIAPESHRFPVTVRYAPFRTRSGRIYRLLFSISGSEVAVLFVRGPGQDHVEP